MPSDTLVQTINSLTTEQQQLVREFVEFLKRDAQPSSPFLSAADEFIRRHPELLRRLAQ
jgi:hypothetical protein